MSAAPKEAEVPRPRVARTARDFYVCVVCGYTSETKESDHCPVCNLAWEKFEVIR